MAKNVYFSGGTRSEQRLYEDLIIESLKIYGHDVYYLPREIVNEDDLFTEDVLSKFDENYMIEMYISNYEGFEGDGSLLTKFGVRISDEATFIIAKRRWEDLISSSNNLVSAFRPNEGDAIYLPLTDQLFQIKFVEHEKPFRQLDGIQTYGLVAELMEFSNERLETGIAEIDNLARITGYTTTFKITDGIKDFIVTSGGTGYGSGTTVTIGGIGSGATATASITSGVVTSVNLIEPGLGYTTAPPVSVVGNGNGAGVTALIASKGNFKTGETVQSQSRTAIAIPVMNADTVQSVTLYSGGSGYKTAPSVTFSKPDAINGTTPTATTTINSVGQVSSIILTDTGSGYLTPPRITVQASPNEATAKVVRFDTTNKELEVTDIVGKFTDNDSLLGLTSGSEWTINTFSSIENENDPEAENDFFESEGDNIIDWTEGNPFGEYGNQGVFLMLGTHFYHEIIRKTIVGFGTLFNNIELRRTDNAGNVVQSQKIPLSYGPREKFLARIDAEPQLDGRSETQITLPRIAFEMQGITYDPSRKLGPIQICTSPKTNTTDAVYTQYSPVPYNLDFELNIISKNNNDSVQILEQILPYFQPMFNISIKLVELTKETKDIPIILNNVSMQDDYEGDFRTRRSLIHTLTFTAKTYLYGPVATTDVIRTVNVDIGAAINAGARYVRYSATPKATEDYNSDGSSISFTDFNISSNTITLANHGFITGDFVTYRSDPNGQPTGGLTDSKEYYIIKIDNDNFRVAGTKYNAQRGYGIDLTSQGTGGNHKFSIINTLDDAFVEPDDNFGFNETWTDY